MSTIAEDTPEPRPGYTWVDSKDGVAAHWERARANEPAPAEAENVPPATTTVDDLKDDEAKDGKKGKKHKKHDKDDDDDDDDHDRHDKKHKNKKHDKDDDDDDHGKKDKKRDRDDDDDEAPADSSTVPPVMTAPTPQPSTGPVVRDHRDGDQSDAPGGVTVTPSHNGPTVRDHRGAEPPPMPPTPSNNGPTVRDHRDEAPAAPWGQGGGSTVRDHRAPDGNPMVASHLDEFQEMAAAPPDAVGQQQAQAFTSAARDVREHQEQAFTSEVRDQGDTATPPTVHDVDLVGDEVNDLRADVSATFGQFSDAQESFQAEVKSDDWESPATPELEADGAPDLAAQSFAFETTQTEDVDAFADADQDLMAAEPEMSDQLDH